MGEYAAILFHARLSKEGETPVNVSVLAKNPEGAVRALAQEWPGMMVEKLERAAWPLVLDDHFAATLRGGKAFGEVESLRFPVIPSQAAEHPVWRVSHPRLGLQYEGTRLVPLVESFAISLRAELENG